MDEFEEPEEGDLITSDHIHFYQYRKLVLTIKAKERGKKFGEWIETNGPASGKVMWKKIEEYMKQDRFWPNVWFISDRGNAHLMIKKDYF